MHILIVAATSLEIEAVKPFLKNTKHDLQYFVHGVGNGITAVKLGYWLKQNEQPHLLIQVGIAGAINPNLTIKETVLVSSILEGDLGVYENDQWSSISDVGLNPLADSVITNKYAQEVANNIKLPLVLAANVNQVSTSNNFIQQVLINKFKADIEIMEGFAFEYFLKVNNLKGFQLRGISNAIGERNKQNWQIQAALQKVGETLDFFLSNL
jgi:futalosine hydrolase